MGNVIFESGTAERRWASSGGGGTAAKFVKRNGSVAAVDGLARPANTNPHMPSKDTRMWTGMQGRHHSLYGHSPVLIPDFFFLPAPYCRPNSGFFVMNSAADSFALPMNFNNPPPPFIFIFWAEQPSRLLHASSPQGIISPITFLDANRHVSCGEKQSTQVAGEDGNQMSAMSISSNRLRRGFVSHPEGEHQSDVTSLIRPG